MSKKPVILIADDDPEILTMLGIRLSKKGYQVLEAVDGNQTLNLARKHHPDLVLLDVMMPGKNGWEVAKELRSDNEFSNLGIVMLTATVGTITRSTIRTIRSTVASKPKFCGETKQVRCRYAIACNRRSQFPFTLTSVS